MLCYVHGTKLQFPIPEPLSAPTMLLNLFAVTSHADKLIVLKLYVAASLLPKLHPAKY